MDACMMRKINGSYFSWMVRAVLELEIVRRACGGREPFEKGKGTMPLTQEWNTKPGWGNEGQVGKCTCVMYHISTSSISDLSDIFCCFPTFSVVSDVFRCFRCFPLFPTLSVVSDVFRCFRCFPLFPMFSVVSDVLRCFRRFPLFPTFSAFFHLFPFVFCPILQFPILGSDRIDSGFSFDPTPFLLAT